MCSYILSRAVTKSGNHYLIPQPNKFPKVIITTPRNTFQKRSNMQGAGKRERQGFCLLLCIYLFINLFILFIWCQEY